MVIHHGDALQVLSSLEDGSVDCCVTSPPYWGLRDYGVAGQIGLEPTPEEYVARMVEVFREVRRVLKAQGTLWLNLGDSYANDTKWGGVSGGLNDGSAAAVLPIGQRVRRNTGLKPKDLVGIPWRVAFALQADGWWLRSDIIWHKPNPRPESVTDRPTKAHEYIFLLAKSERYFYDATAIKEPTTGTSHARGRGVNPKASPRSKQNASFSAAVKGVVHDRNRRSVWTVTSQPFKGAHFATFPEKLIEPCILAGCAANGTVLDPFMGSGTTGLIALRHGRDFVGIELNHSYITMAETRLKTQMPLLSEVNQ